MWCGGGSWRRGRRSARFFQRRSAASGATFVPLFLSLSRNVLQVTSCHCLVCVYYNVKARACDVCSGANAVCVSPHPPPPQGSPRRAILKARPAAAREVSGDAGTTHIAEKPQSGSVVCARTRPRCKEGICLRRRRRRRAALSANAPKNPTGTKGKQKRVFFGRRAGGRLKAAAAAAAQSGACCCCARPFLGDATRGALSSRSE